MQRAGLSSQPSLQSQTPSQSFAWPMHEPSGHGSCPGAQVTRPAGKGTVPRDDATTAGSSPRAARPRPLTRAERLVRASRAVLRPVADSGRGQAEAVGALEAAVRADAVPLVAEVPAVVVPVAAVRVGHAAPCCAAELPGAAGRAAACGDSGQTPTMGQGPPPPGDRGVGAPSPRGTGTRGAIRRVLGPLTCLVRVVGEAAVQLPVADTCPGDAAAAGAAELRGGAGGWGAAALVGAVGAVGHAVAAGAPGHALPPGAAVLVGGAARGADLVRAVPAVVLVVAEPGARHAAPAGAAGELRVGAAGLGRAGLGAGGASPQPGRARAAGRPGLSPGAWCPRACSVPAAAAAPGMGTPPPAPHSPVLAALLHPGAGREGDALPDTRALGGVDAAALCPQNREVSVSTAWASPTAAPGRPHAHRAAPSPRGRSSPPGTTWCRSARAAPGRSFGRSGGRGGRRRCTPAPRHTAWLRRQGVRGLYPASPGASRTPSPDPPAHPRCWGRGLTAQVLAPPADVDTALAALLGVGGDGRAQALAVPPGVTAAERARRGGGAGAGTGTGGGGLRTPPRGCLRPSTYPQASKTHQS